MSGSINSNLINRNFSLIGVSALFLASAFGPSPAYSNEECIGAAQTNFEEWKSSAGTALNELSAQCEELGDESCLNTMVSYKGMQLPIAAAIIIEGDNYGRQADKKLNDVVAEARTCMGDEGEASTSYEFARDKLEIQTILPERATRIDFEEIRRGNVLGGKNSIIREAGRDIDKVLNPFRW